MTLRLRTPSRSIVRALVGLLAVATATGAFLWYRGPAAVSAPPPALTPPTEMDPAKVMGTQACLDCHKPIIQAWQTTTHATNFDKLAANPNAQGYAKALGIATADITGKSVCATCHGMRAEATATKSITGVGCESCHGASGGENGWLNPHGSYGAKDVTREQETEEHRKMRFELCDKAGMIRPERAYLLARNCLQCHMMTGHENVVSVAGHHAGSAEFELVTWTNGEVAHNLFIDPKVNAEAPSLWMWRYKKNPKERNRVLYVVGKLAAMEVVLRNVANAKSDGSFSFAMAGHARDYRDDLSDIRDATMLPGVAKVIEEFNKQKRKVKPDNKAALLTLADLVSETALDIAKNQDGSKLGGVDSLMPTSNKGKRYKPE
jgi:hypothetical protein